MSEWLQVWGAAIGERERFAPGLLLPRELTDQLALVPPKSREQLADRLGWREPVVGAALADALAGEVTVRLSDGDVILDARRGGDRAIPRG